MLLGEQVRDLFSPFSFAPLIDDFSPFFGKPIKEHGHARSFRIVERSSWRPDVWNEMKRLSFFKGFCGREEDCHESSLRIRNPGSRVKNVIIE